MYLEYHRVVGPAAGIAQPQAVLVGQDVHVVLLRRVQVAAVAEHGIVQLQASGHSESVSYPLGNALR